MTSHSQHEQPKPCADNCGFFGAAAATMNLCSKCYRRFLVEQEEQRVAAAEAAPSEVITSSPPPSTVAGGEEGKKKKKAANRCWSCEKKVGLMGVRCKCGRSFCGTHRYPEMHECTFDFKGAGRDVIAKANPVVKADKVDRF